MLNEVYFRSRTCWNLPHRIYAGSQNPCMVSTNQLRRRIVLLPDWLPTKAEETRPLYYLTHSWRGEIDLYVPQWYLRLSKYNELDWNWNSALRFLITSCTYNLHIQPLRAVMDISIENDSVEQSSNSELVSLLTFKQMHLGKAWIDLISPSMGQTADQTGLSGTGRKPIWEKENSIQNQPE